MSLPSISRRLYLIATAYFVVAVCLGYFMGMTQDFTLLTVHAHFNLLGWVSLALIGGIYQLNPLLATTKLATAHFWLHNIGAPLMMVGVGAARLGHEFGEPMAGIFATVTVLGVFCFAINLWRGLNRA